MGKLCNRLWVYTVLESREFTGGGPGRRNGSGCGVSGSGRKVELFDGAAELVLRERCEFLDSSAYNKACFGEEKRLYRDAAARLIPLNEEEGWSVYFEYGCMGHLGEIYTVDKEYIRNYYMGKAEFYIEPAYDYEKHKLFWCVKVTCFGKNSYYVYEELIFTRKGYLSVRLFCGTDEVSALIKYIEGALTVSAGNTYGDFDRDNDAVCDYDFAGKFLYYVEPDWNWNRQGRDYTWNYVDILVRRFERRVKALIKAATRFSNRIELIDYSKPEGEGKARKRRTDAVKEKRMRQGEESHTREAGAPEDSYYRKLRAEEERNARKHGYD